jgi:fermentation-respiration switch protein FrsA (DUF1100 family)
MIGWIALGYAAVTGAAYFGQRALIYPVRGRGAVPELAGSRLEQIPAPDGSTVFALHLPAPADGFTLVHFHGNGEELAGLSPLLLALHRSGLGVYAVEYPGYGLARAGAPSEAALYFAADIALRHLRNALRVPERRTVLQGQSLGTAVAVEMARRGHGSKLVLISPFTSLPELAARVVPFLPVRRLVRDRYDSIAKVGALEIPVLAIHGDRDEVVPFAMGEELAARLKQGRFVPIHGGRHNDLFARFESRMISEIAGFVRGDDAGD